MLGVELVSRIDSYWTEFLGCTQAQLESPEPVLVAPPPARAVDRNVYLLQRGEAGPVVSLPEDLVDRAGDLFEGAAAPAFFDLAARGLIGGTVEAVYGPAWLGYAAELDLIEVPREWDIRSVRMTDAQELEELRQRCSPEDRANVASLSKAVAMFGCWVAGSLAGVAGYQVWGGTLAHLAVLVDPAQRGMRIGRAVILAAARDATDGGLIPQYRCLFTNLPSRAVAESVGFSAYGRSVTIRCSPVATS